MEKIFYEKLKIDSMINELYEQIKPISDRIDTVVGISRGGLYISIPLAEMLGKEHKEITIKFYNKQNQPINGEEPIEVDIPKLHPSFLLVDDLVDSGKTINYFIKKTGFIHNFDFYIACLFHKIDNPYNIHPCYFVEEKPDAWVEFYWEKISRLTDGLVYLEKVKNTPYLTLDKLKQLKIICDK